MNHSIDYYITDKLEEVQARSLEARRGRVPIYGVLLSEKNTFSAD